MTARVSLALILHNHQPVGNFGWVIARNHELAYEPLVGALERHPGVRLALHYSGPLLEWLAAERPAFLDRLGALVAREQVELLGGGYFEPVLGALPVADRLAQLRRLSDALLDRFGRRPTGAWLAERVWEPDLPATLVDAGYRWTVLDDAHLRAATVPEDDLWGAYSTDDQGRRLDLFATGKGLRYRIPFGEVDDVVRYLGEHATADGSRLGTMGDDGEKFGAWPTTWAHCWGEGRWMERFFEALEAAADWLHTTTPSAWLTAHPPVARVYVPGGSYAEMGGWALEPDEAEAYRATLNADLAAGRPEPRWMHGASWRNFQHRYRESNDLHKQMLRTSAKVGALAPGPLREQAADRLQRGQGNDPYWHGLFGGLYLSHLRTAALGHLIAAEDLADAEARRGGRSRDGVSAADLDLDGRAEILFAAPGQVVSVKPDEGAGIGEWDVRAVHHALTAVLRRRPEAYHRHLLEVETLPPAEAPAGVVSPHERRLVREADLVQALVYDGYERRSALVRLVRPGVRAQAVASGQPDGLDDFVAGPFEVVRRWAGGADFIRRGAYEGPRGMQRVEVVKSVAVDRRRRRPGLEVAVTVTPLDDRLEATLCLEWSLNLSGGGGNPAAFFEPAPGRRVRFDGTGGLRRAARLRFGNRDIGLTVTAHAEPAAAVAWASIDTVSLSEAGAERMHQGSCVVFTWPLRLAVGHPRTVRLRMEAATRPGPGTP